MQIARLDHVNIRTNQLAKMIDWYHKILGLEQGNRPDFSFNGAWMYAGDSAVVHLIEVDDDVVGHGSEGKLRLEHFALSATGCEAFETKLQDAGVEFRRSEIKSFKLIQINVWDPDGNHIHIDFAADE